MSDEAKVRSQTPPTNAASAGGDASGMRHASFVIPLWVWVGAGFLFLATLWTAMFFFAGKANVQSVPLATQGATKP